MTEYCTFQVTPTLHQTRTIYQICLVQKFPTKGHQHLIPCGEKEQQGALQRTWQKHLVLVDITRQIPAPSRGRLQAIQCLEEVTCLEVSLNFMKKITLIADEWASQIEVDCTLLLQCCILLWTGCYIVS